MTLARNRVLFAILMLSVAVPVLSAQARTAHLCAFHYTHDVRDRIIAPVLEQDTGPKFFGMYKLDNPVVTPYTGYSDRKDLVLLTFNPTKAEVTPAIGVIFDPCNRRAWVPIGLIE